VGLRDLDVVTHTPGAGVVPRSSAWRDLAAGPGGPRVVGPPGMSDQRVADGRTLRLGRGGRPGM